MNDSFQGVEIYNQSSFHELLLVCVKLNSFILFHFLQLLIIQKKILLKYGAHLYPFMGMVTLYICPTHMLNPQNMVSYGQGRANFSSVLISWITLTHPHWTTKPPSSHAGMGTKHSSHMGWLMVIRLRLSPKVSLHLHFSPPCCNVLV